jgi:hypothetical protein
VSRGRLAVVVSVQFAALIAVCLLIGDNGWDDGAITLAFARTFARHGVVALTPYSETAEGFSSVSWFLINSLVALARPSYQASILASQILSTVCLCVSTLLLARSCALLRLDKLSSALVVITFAAWGCSFSEASNGMEMGLLAVALLAMVNELLAPEPRMFVLAAGVVLAVTTRFEAILYVALLALSVAAVPGRRAFRCIIVAGAAAIALLTIWRLAVFSDVLPNTFWAKRWPPYVGFGLMDRIVGAAEIPSFFIVPLVSIALLWSRGLDVRSVVAERRRAFEILGAPILGAIVMGLLIGKHWGYKGRMPFFAFPFALLCLALLFSSWVSAPGSKLRCAAAIVVSVVLIGLSMTGFPRGELRAALAGGTFAVSPRTYAESGRVFRRLASGAGLEHAAILTPDLGGLALCCDEFRLVDLGLLSNRRLAHRGPAALAEVLESESPDIVEAHWQWAAAGKLYELPYFRAQYSPAFAGATKLWLRRDVAKAIESKGRGCWLPADDADLRAALRAHRYAGHDLPADRTAFEGAGAVFALDDAGAPTGTLCGRRARL